MKNQIALIKGNDGQPWADSRNVAERLGRQHFHVLEAIRNLDMSSEFKDRHYRCVKIKDLTGESTSHVLMTEHGFISLCRALRGGVAAEIFEAFVNEFFRMREELAKLQQIQAIPDLNDPETLQHLLLTQLEERKRLTAMLHESQNHVEKLVDRVVDAEACAESFRLLAGTSGTFCLTDAAKNLDVSPRQWLIPWMQANKWIYKRLNSKVWIPHQYRLDTGDLTFKLVLDETGVMREQCRVTPRGMTKLAKVVVELYKAETGVKLLTFKRKPAVKKS